MAIGKPILEGSSQAQKRSRTQILTPSDPKISGKEPKTLILLYLVHARRNLFPRNYLRFLLFLASPNRVDIETTT